MEGFHGPARTRRMTSPAISWELALAVRLGMTGQVPDTKRSRLPSPSSCPTGVALPRLIVRVDAQSNLFVELGDHLPEFFIGHLAQVPRADGTGVLQFDGVSRHLARVFSQKICAVTLPFLAELNRSPPPGRWPWSPRDRVRRGNACAASSDRCATTREMSVSGMP